MNRKEYLRKHKIRSRLEEEKFRKKQIQEEEEKLDVLGQKSEHKAAKWVIEEGKKADKLEQKKQDDDKTKLQDGRKTIKGYKEILMTQLFHLLREIDWPRAYEYGVWFDGKGVILAVKDKYGKIRKRAFKPSYDPKYDYHMVMKFAVWAEDVLDFTEGKLEGQRSPGGIWLPSSGKN